MGSKIVSVVPTLGSVNREPTLSDAHRTLLFYDILLQV